MKLEVDLNAVVIALFEANPNFSLQNISDELGISNQKITHDLGLTNHHYTVTMGKVIPVLNRLVGPIPSILRLLDLSKERFEEEVSKYEKRVAKQPA